MSQTRIRQSVSWWCFVPDKLTPAELLRAAADIGYEAIDLVAPEHWPLVKQYGLKLAAVNGHTTLTDGLNRRENRARIAQELRDNLTLAVKWDVAALICFSGNRRGVSDDEGAEITAETLRQVAPMAEDTGITLILELLNSKVDHPDYQCDRTAWGVKVCQMVNSSRVKLLYDIYHMQIMEGDLIRTIQDSHQHFAHYHTAGNPGRHEIDDSQEINYKSIMRAISDTGYDGYVAQEFVPVGDPVLSLRAAFNACNVN